MSEERTCLKCGWIGTEYFDEIDGNYVSDGFICSNPNCSGDEE